MSQVREVFTRLLRVPAPSPERIAAEVSRVLRQKEAARFRDLLAPGQEVMTGSGFFGTVSAVDGDRITLASEGIRTVWLRQAIAKVVEAEAEASERFALENADDATSHTTPDDRDQPHS